MDKFQRSVHEFHQMCGLGYPERPSLEGFPGELRVRLIEEEADEFAEAVRDSDMVGMIDALCDLLYVTYGAAVCLGVDLEPFFDEVHRSNMAKRGGPLRPDGKQLKPPDWQPPRIAEVLAEQLAEGRRAGRESGGRGESDVPPVPPSEST